MHQGRDGQWKAPPNCSAKGQEVQKNREIAGDGLTLFPGRFTSPNGFVDSFHPKMKKCHIQILQTVHERQGSANMTWK